MTRYAHSYLALCHLIALTVMALTIGPAGGNIHAIQIQSGCETHFGQAVRQASVGISPSTPSAHYTSTGSVQPWELRGRESAKIMFESMSRYGQIDRIYRYVRAQQERGV